MLLNHIFAELLCSWVNSDSKDRRVFKAGLELFGVGSSSPNLNLTAKFYWTILVSKASFLTSGRDSTTGRKSPLVC